MSLFGPPNVEKLKAKKDISGLIKALNFTKDDNIRQAAAQALGEIGDRRAVEPLITVLNDTDWEKRVENLPVRCAAATALGQIGDPGAIESLSEALCDSEYEVRDPAADALIAIGGPATVEAVISVLKSHRLVNKDNLIRVLCATGKSSLDSITALLDEGNDTDSRHIAAYVLGEIGDPRAVDPLIKTLKDKTEHVRTRAAHSLGQIGDPRAVDPLIVALTDNWRDMRKAAAEALAKIGTPQAREALAAYENSLPVYERKGPKLPARLPGPLPVHVFVSSANLDEEPSPGKSEFEIALSQWNEGRYDQAAEHYLKAIELGLTSVYEAAARSNLGKIFLIQDKVESAVDQFIKGLYLSPLTASSAYSCSSYLAIIYEELHMSDDMLAIVGVAKAALKQIDSIMSAEAANKVRATVRRVYKL